MAEHIADISTFRRSSGWTSPVTHQVMIGCSGGGLRHSEEALLPTPAHAASLGEASCD